MNINAKNIETIMKKHTTKLTILAALLSVIPGAQAQEEHHHHEAAASEAPAAMSTGEVVKVDKEAGKITLRHGPLENLGMPGMTMAFRAGEPGRSSRVTRCTSSLPGPPAR